MNTLAPVERLRRFERLGLVVLAVLLVGFGGIVELRGALLRTRHTDLGVFVRTAWAVRAGADLYTVCDDNGLHYHYPPLFAILLSPLADPPPGADRAWTPPFALTVALWYLASLGFLAGAVHMLAVALEQNVGAWAQRPQDASSRRWWALRVLPLLACAPYMFVSLSRGQVTSLLLLLLCGMAAALVRGQSFRAGLWLAGAICLKVIPAFLLLYPLWRRDRRCLAGCALGLAVGLALVPAAVFGPRRTVDYYREWTNVLIMPAFGMGADRSRAGELLDVTATHSQSLQAVFHNLLHPDPATRPAQVSTPVRLAHWLCGGLLTLATLLAARQLRWPASGLPHSPIHVVLFLGALIAVMLVVCPADHPHYLLLLAPLVLGLAASAWDEQDQAGLSLRWRLLLTANFCAGVLPLLPELHVLHDVGLAMCAALLLWLTGLGVIWRDTFSRSYHAPRRSRRPATEVT